MRGELVSSLTDGVLVVVGLTPFGTRAFSAEQRGRRIEIDFGIARRIGLEPLHLLAALQRTAWPPGRHADALDDRAETPTRIDPAVPVDFEDPRCGYRTRLLVLP